jgi:glycosyltransferase involved in cell wall biosynthesis
LLAGLAEVPGIDLTMIHGTNLPAKAIDVGLSMATGPMPFRTIAAPISGLRWQGQELLWFGEALRVMKQESFDVVISDYYLRLLSIWAMQSIQRKMSAGFILWGIGFHQQAKPLLDRLRLLLVRRTDALLLYSNEGKKRYTAMGVPTEKCFVLQNTVDLEGIESAIAVTTEQDVQEYRQRLGTGEGPILIHIGRLARNKRLDLLIRALASLQERWPAIQLVLIGEGPELEVLQTLAGQLAVADRVHFTGAITNQKELAPWVLAADLIVAPAQIGLMAPMSFAYGKTLVISDVPEHHYPEVQVVVPDQTGLAYRFEDVDDLCRKITILLADSDLRRRFAEAGRRRVFDTMGPEIMLQGFLDAIHSVTQKKSAMRLPRL